MLSRLREVPRNVRLMLRRRQVRAQSLAAFDRRRSDIWAEPDTIWDLEPPVPDPLQRFYSSTTRSRSREIAFGPRWNDGHPGGWTLWWIEDTGGLAAMRTEWTEAISGEGTFAPQVHSSFEAPIVLGVEPDEARVREMLTGWEQHIAEANGWAWVRARVADALEN